VRCAAPRACLLCHTLPKPCARASPLPLAWQPGELTRGRCGAGGAEPARGLLEGHSFAESPMFCVDNQRGWACVVDRWTRGHVETRPNPAQISCPPTMVRGPTRFGRPTWPGCGGVQLGVQVEVEFLWGGGVARSHNDHQGARHRHRHRQLHANKDLTTPIPDSPRIHHVARWARDAQIQYFVFFFSKIRINIVMEILDRYNRNIRYPEVPRQR
jgi:hypothetical protein